MRFDRIGVPAAVVLATLGVVFVALNGITVSPADSAPPGQLMYRLARLFGLLAAYLICIQVLGGLANTMKLRWLWPWGRKGHVLTFVAFTAALFCHIGFFIIAVGIRTGDFPIHLLLPDFTHGYYRTSISLGAIALFGVAITAAAGWRRLKRSSIAGPLHALAYATFALVVVHSINIGSETRSYSILVVLAAATFLVIGLLCARRFTGVKRL